jgi:hypothetical protein
MSYDPHSSINTSELTPEVNHPLNFSDMRPFV